MGLQGSLIAAPLTPTTGHRPTGRSGGYGRWTVLLVESGVAAVSVVIAATAIVGPVCLLVAGYAGHGFKDLWQYRTHYVANTRWWPPFCCVVDWIAAVLISGELVAGVHFHQLLSGAAGWATCELPLAGAWSQEDSLGYSDDSRTKLRC
jgi:hypothetical protein